ncbi:MAG: DUF4179 domain-containing protein [Lachnospiraceae bacterium]|nr:DUF4179 domain-containing protein [Lachnospiraceae bacterium]
MNRRIDEIPVSNRLNDAVALGLHRAKFIQKKRRIKRSLAAAASVAVAFSAFLFWGFSNPILASQIPFIGRIFMENEQKISFPGNYSDKAEVLSTEIPAIEPSTEETPAGKPVPYTVHDAGYSITANEIYCDGSSVYIAMTIHADNGFGHMYGIDPETFQQEHAQIISVFMADLIIHDGEQATEFNLPNVDIEGTQTALDTFEGILKLNLGDAILSTGKSYTADLQVYSLYYGADDSPDIYPGVSGICGDWKITSIPFTVDGESVKEYAIEDMTAEGFGIGNVIVTPFEIKVEYFRSSPDADYGTALFDANGKRLLFHEETPSTENNGFLATYSVGDADISTLHIYIGEDAVGCIKENSQEAMEERAVYTYLLETNMK